MTVDDYLTALDRAARLFRPGKKGSIPRDLSPILERLELDVDCFVAAMRDTGKLIGNAIGTKASLANELARRGKKRIRGVFDIDREPEPKPDP